MTKSLSCGWLSALLVLLVMMTGSAIAGQVGVTRETGTLVFLEGGSYVVRMSDGEIRTGELSPGWRATIDGRSIPANQIPIGTALTATYTTTQRTQAQRTVSSATGTVWYASGATVILALPDGNHKFTVDDSFTFTVEGKPATAYDLRRGMRATVTTVTEDPITVFSTNSRITGTSPRPEQVARVATQPTPAAVATQPAGQLPATLPKTASPLPLMGMLGLTLTGLAFGIRRRSRS